MTTQIMIITITLHFWQQPVDCLPPNENGIITLRLAPTIKS